MSFYANSKYCNHPSALTLAITSGFAVTTLVAEAANDCLKCAGFVTALGAITGL
jgi:hypothetical protein